MVEHSKQIGDPPLVISSDYYTAFTDEGQSWEGARITLTIPRGFDFDKQGSKLLRAIKSAANLFYASGATEGEERQL